MEYFVYNFIVKQFRQHSILFKIICVRILCAMLVVVHVLILSFVGVCLLQFCLFIRSMPIIQMNILLTGNGSLVSNSTKYFRSVTK